MKLKRASESIHFKSKKEKISPIFQSNSTTDMQIISNRSLFATQH